jgi:hypothetical protein
MGSFSLELRHSRFSDDVWWEIGLVDERTAMVFDKQATANEENGHRLRLTPPNQKTVADLLFPGDIITTNQDYDKGRKYRLISVRRFEVYGLPEYSLTLVDLEAKPNKYGEYKENDLRWINECVAQDGRVLMLFEANDEEILLVERGPSSCRVKQLTGEWVLKTKSHPLEARKAIIEIDNSGVGYGCHGCDCSCGGHSPARSHEEIESQLAYYKRHLMSCQSAKEAHHYINISVRDCRKIKSKVKQGKLQEICA